MPPRIDPKAKGMRILPGGRFCFAAIWIAMGISRARAPTLFMKPDNKAARLVRARMPPVGPAFFGSRRFARMFIAPESCSP